MLTETNNHYDDEPEGLEPGGSVPVIEKPKRTRAPNKAKDGGAGSGGVKAEGGAYYLLIDKAGQVVIHSADPAEVRKAAAKAILEPDHALYRAEVVTPDSVFQK
jgi:hypothetical protein